MLILIREVLLKLTSSKIHLSQEYIQLEILLIGRL